MTVRRRIRFTRECTLVTERWCAVHGTCTCTRSNGYGGRAWAEVGANGDCRLHGTVSTHPGAKRTRYLSRRVR